MISSFIKNLFSTKISLESVSSNRKNNILLLRWVAAILVILSHSFPLSGSTFEPYKSLTHYETFGGLGVAIFFILSGFLITASWCRKAKLGSFLQKRVRRILPGLAMANLVTTILIGLVFYSRSLLGYISSQSTLGFFIHNTILYPVTYLLGAAFANNPYPGAVNGSLWSLPYEVTMYIGVATMGLIGLVRRRWISLVVVCGLLFLLIHKLTWVESHTFAHMLVSLWLPLALYFAMGAVFFLYREYIVLSGGLALLIAAIYVLSWRSPFTQLASFACLPYLVIWLSYYEIPLLKRFQNIDDLSYGLYIYAFPVQQLLMHFIVGRVSPITLFALALPCTLVLADWSWRYIEKPALNFSLTKKGAVNHAPPVVAKPAVS